MMNTNDAVSLDFWNGLAFYSGKSFPSDLICMKDCVWDTLPRSAEPAGAGF